MFSFFRRESLVAHENLPNSLFLPLLVSRLAHGKAKSHFTMYRFHLLLTALLGAARSSAQRPPIHTLATDPSLDQRSGVSSWMDFQDTSTTFTTTTYRLTTSYPVYGFCGYISGESHYP